MLQVIDINVGYTYPTVGNDVIPNARPNMTATVIDTEENTIGRVVLCDKVFSLDDIGLSKVNRTIVKAFKPNALFAVTVIWSQDTKPQETLRQAYDDLGRMLGALDMVDAIGGEHDVNDIRDMIEYCNQYK